MSLRPSAVQTLTTSPWTDVVETVTSADRYTRDHKIPLDSHMVGHFKFVGAPISAVMYANGNPIAVGVSEIQSAFTDFPLLVCAMDKCVHLTITVETDTPYELRWRKYTLQDSSVDYLHTMKDQSFTFGYLEYWHNMIYPIIGG